MSLLFAYALLANAMLASLLDARAIAAAADPLLSSSFAATENPICMYPGADPAGGPAGDKNRSGGDHRTQCPLCGSACPMGAGAPISSGSVATLDVTPPHAAAVLGAAGPAFNVSSPRSVHPFDAPAQAPPALA